MKIISRLVSFAVIVGLVFGLILSQASGPAQAEPSDGGDLSGPFELRFSWQEGGGRKHSQKTMVVTEEKAMLITEKLAGRRRRTTEEVPLTKWEAAAVKSLRRVAAFVAALPFEGTAVITSTGGIMVLDGGHYCLSAKHGSVEKTLSWYFGAHAQLADVTSQCRGWIRYLYDKLFGQTGDDSFYQEPEVPSEIFLDPAAAAAIDMESVRYDPEAEIKAGNGVKPEKTPGPLHLQFNGVSMRNVVALIASRTGEKITIDGPAKEKVWLEEDSIEYRDLLKLLADLHGYTIEKRNGGIHLNKK